MDKTEAASDSYFKVGTSDFYFKVEGNVSYQVPRTRNFEQQINFTSGNLSCLQNGGNFYVIKAEDYFLCVYIVLLRKVNQNATWS